jgi:hypothetical protein
MDDEGLAGRTRARDSALPRGAPAGQKSEEQKSALSELWTVTKVAEGRVLIRRNDGEVAWIVRHVPPDKKG